MREVRDQSKMQSWTAVAVMVLMGIILGVFSCYYFFARDLNQVDDRLDTIQQQIALPVQAPDAKPTAVPSTKAHHGGHAATAPRAHRSPLRTKAGYGFDVREERERGTNRKTRSSHKPTASAAGRIT